MSGRLAAILLLLTVVLLSDEDPYSASRIPEIALFDAFRHTQHRVGGRRSSRWIPVARASPLEHRLSTEEDGKAGEEAYIMIENGTIDEASPLSTDLRWKPFRNETRSIGDTLGDPWIFPGGTKVPMGWADPRLRGGQMLDVSILPIYSLMNWLEYCELDAD